MKTVTLTVLFLFLLSLCAFSVIGSNVFENAPDVTVTENVIYGDKSYADGITVTVKSQYDRHLNWDTAYTIGDTQKTVTDYTFHYLTSQPQNMHKHQGVYLDVFLKYGYDITVPLEESTGIQKAYRTLYDQTAPGTRGTKMIRLQDYYDYYPISVSIDLPGTVWLGHDYEGLASQDYINERIVWDAFNSFFKIPIPEDLAAFEISIEKDSHGNGFSIGSSHEFDYGINPISVHTKDRCFFSIQNKYYGNSGDKDRYIDTSQIPGGYGIYAFRYKNVRNDGNTQGTAAIFQPGYETGVEADSLQTVFPLEDHVEVIYMALSNDESKLYLFTKDESITYLTVIDIATMTELQKFSVTHVDPYRFYVYDNCIVLISSKSLSVVEKQDTGLCQLAFTVPRLTEIDSNNGQKGVATVMAFDGEKLVMIDRTGDPVYPTLELCGFTTAIYNSTGLVYYAAYENSLSRVTDPHDYYFNCLPHRYEVALPPKA